MMCSHMSNHSQHGSGCGAMLCGAAGTIAVATGFAGQIAANEATRPDAVAKQPDAVASSPSQRISDDFDIGEQIGSGAYGVVYLGRCKKTRNPVAIKVMPRRGAHRDAAVRNEVGVLRRVGLHRGIAQLHELYEDADSFYLVMEYVSGGELFDALCMGGPYTEKRASQIVRQIADAAAFLHAQGLAHLDIKPENILLTSADADAHVKPVDFGLACETRGNDNFQPGTIAYWPPEVFAQKRVGTETDMWAIGCVLFCVLSGYHPFDRAGDADDETLRERVLHGTPDYDDRCWAQVQPDWLDWPARRGPGFMLNGAARRCLRVHASLWARCCDPIRTSG